MINARIALLFRRFTTLATAAPRPIRLRKPNPNPKPAAAKPAKPPPNWPAAYFPGPPPTLPRSFGWVRRVVPHCNTNSYISQIEHLLTLAETTELIATHPATARALRPLCHMLGIRLPDYLKRPRTASWTNTKSTPTAASTSRQNNSAISSAHPHRPCHPGTSRSSPPSTSKNSGANDHDFVRLNRFDNVTKSTKRQGKSFFFVNKKEAKKTLVIWARAGSNARAPEFESFLLLFYKKEAFLPLPNHINRLSQLDIPLR
ncbi:hypothetical protein [Acidiphilium sp. 34-64-41]|uniref:hypothetical protein n=1 Tax=Acidiphilium sp. 34-64-41 TaxID=1970297 RepID=UPI002580451B|nr:hypothetical protein [Acidiphilium sp. 34-64-41]